MYTPMTIYRCPTLLVAKLLSHVAGDEVMWRIGSFRSPLTRKKFWHTNNLSQRSSFRTTNSRRVIDMIKSSARINYSFHTIVLLCTPRYSMVDVHVRDTSSWPRLFVVDPAFNAIVRFQPVARRVNTYDIIYKLHVCMHRSLEE